MKKEKLTKFSDYFYYYKWHCVAVIVGVVLVWSIVSSVLNRVENDVTLSFMLSNQVGPNTADEITADLTASELIPDINGDGEKLLYTSMMISPIGDMSESATAANYQMSIEFAAGESMLYIIDEDLVEVYEEHEAFADISHKAEEYALEDDDLYIAENGTVIGISLKDNEYLKSKGVVTDTLYACFRNLMESDMTPERQTQVDIADKILNHIVK